MKKTLFIFAAIVISVGMFSQTKWNVDKAHTSLGFTVTHMLITDVDGKFKTFDGYFTSSNPDFTDAVIDFTVDAKSISTDNEMRDNHLKSADFFDTDKFPQITFKSTSFKKVSDKKYSLEGNLTLHGVTKLVKFDVNYGGTVKDPYGNTKVGFKATTVINRFDYDLKWNKLIESGGAVVGQDVTIDLKLEFAQEKK